MNDPYHIQGPALISVSGGRTSGFMLRQIIDAHGGTLPADVIPVFCNTGREHEATLKFLHEIETRWCPIVWLEYRHDFDDLHPQTTFARVDYCSASRNGEPFEQLIRVKKMLPNPVTRFCTSELKIKTADRFATYYGMEHHTRVVGLRYDEPRRVSRVKGNEANEHVVCPMHAAKHTLADVLKFWKSHPFDLELPGGDNTFGNCDMCFLKGRSKIEKIMRTSPAVGEWWAKQEQGGNTFRYDRPTYRQMLTQLTVQGRLYDDAIEDDTLPCACTD